MNMNYEEYNFLSADREKPFTSVFQEKDSNVHVDSDPKGYKLSVDMSVPTEIQEYPNTNSVYCIINGEQRNSLKNKIIYDHLGNKFDNLHQLCAYYYITETKYRSRIRKGWTQKEALTGISKYTRAVDHLGNLYKTKKEMCHEYNISDRKFYARLRVGKSLEEALTGMPPKENLKVEDPLGNRYKNISQMCQAYGVRMDIYCHKKKRGRTLEEILFGTRNTFSSVYDNFGNEYSNVSDMCKAYSVSLTRYNARIKSGWTQEEALTGIREIHKKYDYLGKFFLTQKDMCDYYNIKLETFRYRIKNGWSLKDALTVPVDRNPLKNRNLAIDHLGNKFSTIQDMCNAYNVKKGTYLSRKKRGLTKEQALSIHFYFKKGL